MNEAQEEAIADAIDKGMDQLREYMMVARNAFERGDYTAADNYLSNLNIEIIALRHLLEIEATPPPSQTRGEEPQESNHE